VVSVGQAGDLKIIGDRLGRVTVVRLDGVERKPKGVSDKAVTVELEPTDVAAPRRILITVLTAEGDTAPAATLRVTDLAIQNAALSQGKVGMAFTDTLTAKGGKSPYEWTLPKKPAWLSVGSRSGALTGQPTAAGANAVTVELKDAEGVAVTKEYQLDVSP
jgi:hypothetical protein